jgi:hypothetical protein
MPPGAVTPSVYFMIDDDDPAIGTVHSFGPAAMKT